MHGTTTGNVSSARFSVRLLGISSIDVAMSVGGRSATTFVHPTAQGMRMPHVRPLPHIFDTHLIYISFMMTLKPLLAWAFLVVVFALIAHGTCFPGAVLHHFPAIPARDTGSDHI